MAKRIYIAATRQNDGKTTVSLGLISAMLERGLKVGYMKPVGQRVVQSGDAVVDEDVLLIQRTYGIQGDLQDCSPIGIPKGFTEQYIYGEVASDLPQRIMEGFDRLSRDCDVVVIEGTGHAGVGSVIDLSNATVARMLKADVLIVTLGGIGRPYDEVALNRALFLQEGVRVLGVIANKVLPEKLDKIRGTLDVAFRRMDCSLFGAIPAVNMLSGPTVAQVLEDIEARLLSPAADLSVTATNVVIGTTTPEFVETHFTEPSLLITSGDREDLIAKALEFHARAGPEGPLAAVILTNGFLPRGELLSAVQASRLPVLSVGVSSYRTASDIHDLLVKIRPSDAKKIRVVRELVSRNVDVPAILRAIGVTN